MHLWIFKHHGNILRKSRIRPYKIKYYEKKTDPDFDIKEREILHVYKEVEKYNDEQMRHKWETDETYGATQTLGALVANVLDKPEP